MKKNKGDFKGNYDEILFVKDEIITRIKENRASPTQVDTYPNFNIQSTNAIVNQNSTILHQTVYHGTTPDIIVVSPPENRRSFLRSSR